MSCECNLTCLMVDKDAKKSKYRQSKQMCLFQPRVFRALKPCQRLCQTLVLLFISDVVFVPHRQVLLTVSAFELSGRHTAGSNGVEKERLGGRECYPIEYRFLSFEWVCVCASL